MKSNKIKPQQSALHDEPSNVKLQSIIQAADSESKIYPIEIDIFHYLQLKFQLHQITLNQQQFLHTIFVATPNINKKNACFYLGHGFGGSSLMYFPIIRFLLQYGNVVLWQIRGMGLSRKLQKYHVTLQDSQTFFVKPIQLMLKHYFKYKQIFFISHSFGGYLTLLYLLKYKTFEKNIKQVILLSPVGITPKQQDYKSQVNSFSDVMHVLGNRLSWAFHLTYKSPFRCICACFKNRVFSDAVKDCGFTSQEQRLMKGLLISMVEAKDGSQGVFFNYFQPRVLPKFPLQPLFLQSPSVKINIMYGGQQDWVDKTGAERIKDKYPQKITLRVVKQCGHNFPFFPQLLKKNLQQILQPYKLDQVNQQRNVRSKPQIKENTKQQNLSLEKSTMKKSQHSNYQESSDQSLKHQHKHTQIPIS